MTRLVRLVALCLGRPGDEALRWPAAALERLLRPSPLPVPGPQRCTIGDYWSDCTDGDIDLTPSGALPWLTLPAEHPAWPLLARCVTPDCGESDLISALQELVDAGVRIATEHDVAAAELVHRAQGLVVLTTGVGHLHWAQTVRLADGTTLPAAHLTTHATHTSFAHEIGHVIGFRHSFGLATDGVGEEYGDPYCIMSARRFGGRTAHVTRSLTVSDLLPSEPLWSMVGPRIARATTWVQHHEVAPLDGVRLLEWPSDDVPLRIAHAALPAGPHPQLVAIRTPTGRRWVTLEVRGPLPDVPAGSPTAAGPAHPGVDWDGALNLDRVGTDTRDPDFDTADAPGVVLHEVDLDERRVTYRRTVPLPLSGDTDARVHDPAGPLVVRATGYADGVAMLLVGTAPSVRMAWVRTSVELAGDVLRISVQALTAGYDEPVLSWTVGGVPIVVDARLGDVPVRAPVVPGVSAEACWDGLLIDVPGALSRGASYAAGAGAGSAAGPASEPLAVQLDAREGALLGHPGTHGEPRITTATLDAADGRRTVTLTCTAW